jgi:DNA helicase-2/ATP-dependent DNA helicase PcrA
VDEYQDTNHAQYILVKELVGTAQEGLAPAELCVVGDADQSIYGFRGATIRNILQFELDYPNATTVLLEQNYRSTQNILSAANAVITKNESRKEKNLWSEAGSGAPLIGYVAESEHDEAEFIKDEIRELQRSGQSEPGDTAIFYRTNAQSRVFEEVFMRSALPYKVVGGLRFYERKEIKDLLAYLRVLANLEDEISLRRIINVPKRGIGDATETAIATYAEQSGIPLRTALSHVSELGFGPKVTSAIHALADMLNEISATIETDPVDLVLKNVLEKSGYLASLRASRDPQDEARVENLDELVAVLAPEVLIELLFDSELTDEISESIIHPVSLTKLRKLDLRDLRDVAQEVSTDVLVAVFARDERLHADARKLGVQAFNLS